VQFRLSKCNEVTCRIISCAAYFDRGEHLRGIRWPAGLHTATLSDPVVQHFRRSASRFYPRTRLFRGLVFRGCRHFAMFKPLSLFASQIAPTAASFPTGRPRLLRPGISCFVTSARSALRSSCLSTSLSRRSDTGQISWRKLSRSVHSRQIYALHP
jgi:hypothetical protein